MASLAAQLLGGVQADTGNLGKAISTGAQQGRENANQLSQIAIAQEQNKIKQDKTVIDRQKLDLNKGKFVMSAVEKIDALANDPAAAQIIAKELNLTVANTNSSHLFTPQTIELLGKSKSYRMKAKTVNAMFANDEINQARYFEIVNNPAEMDKIPEAPDGFAEAAKERRVRQAKLDRAKIRAAGQDKGDDLKANRFEQGLRKEFNARSEVKDFLGVKTHFSNIESTLGGKGTAAGDIAGIISFMKMLDPTSVVREGEFAVAASARGMTEAAVNIFKRMDTGERLTPNQRADFLNQARKVKKARREAFDPVFKRFSDLATDKGFRPVNVVGELRARDEGDKIIVGKHEFSRLQLKRQLGSEDKTVKAKAEKVLEIINKRRESSGQKPIAF